MKYSIIFPAGSGKSTLAKKYENLYDIDNLLSREQKVILKEKFYECIKSGNWGSYSQLEYEFTKEKVINLPDNGILLTHSVDKAKTHNLQVLGIFKTNEKIMNEVANSRDEFRAECVRHNDVVKLRLCLNFVTSVRLWN